MHWSIETAYGLMFVNERYFLSRTFLKSVWPEPRSGVRTKSWTLKGSEREHEMYSKEQREKALALYDKCHSVTKVMQSLGYPESRAGLYLWLKQRNAPPKKKAERKQINKAPNHPLHPSLETKLAILHRCSIDHQCLKKRPRRQQSSIEEQGEGSNR